MNNLIWRVSQEPDVPPPRVEVGGIWLNVLAAPASPMTIAQVVRVENELVWREKDGTKGTLKMTKSYLESVMKKIWLPLYILLWSCCIWRA